MEPDPSPPPSPRPARPARRLRRGVTVLAGLGCLAAAVGVVAHYRAAHQAPLLGVSAFAPYLMLAAPIALLLLLACRRWLPAVGAAALTGVWAWTQAPLYVSAEPPQHARTVVTMTSNLRLGQASADELVSAVRRDHVELLMLEELTPDEQYRLADAGLDQLLPYHLSDPWAAALGTGLWSRYPLHGATRRTDFTFAFITATVAVPGLAREPFVAALHLAGPWPHAGNWGATSGGCAPCCRPSPRATR